MSLITESAVYTPPFRTTAREKSGKDKKMDVFRPAKARASG